MTQDQLLQSQSVTSRQGSIGEQFALAYERKRLPEFLHGKIVHFEEHEIALGYDILSFETRTSILPDRYIEVKTFRGHPHFFWSENEIATARKYGEHYYLYLIDIDCINEPNYEPQIISNPAVLFNEDRPTEEMEHSNTHNAKNASNGHTWTFQPVQYVFSLNAEAHIPQDWNTSTILLGCYNTDEHLRWIIEHNLYNVRTGKNSPGAVSHSDPQVHQATYLVLYSVSNPRVYMLYQLDPHPYKVTKTEMRALGYTNPHALSYILHPIQERLHSFHLDLAPLLREVNHQGGNTYGTPLYLTGIQLRRFMSSASEATTSVPDAPSSGEAPSRQGSSWTPEDDNLLLTQLQQHTPIAEIAPLLHRTEKAILRRMSRLRKAEVISYDLYIHYYDEDPTFISSKRFQR